MVLFILGYILSIDTITQQIKKPLYLYSQFLH